jgi:phosphatidylinositol glycan class B
MIDRSTSLASGRSGLGQHLWLLILAFCAAGFALRLGTAVAFSAIERPDEIFQNLEPAHRLWTGQGIVTWEWRAGIRSWLFPGALSGLMFLTSLFHLPDATALPLIWAVLGLVSCGVIAVGVSMGWRQFGATGALLCGILTAFWPDLVYFGPKTLGEVQSGNLLVVAAALASSGPVKRDSWRLAAIGVLLGAAFDLRFQLSLSLLLVACWAARLDIKRSWIPLILGAALPLVALGFVDWWTLGSPFQSVWKNIQVNLIQNKAQAYGVDPIHTYFYYFSARNGAAVVAMYALFVYGFRVAPLLALTAISVVAFHSLIAHKEISFVYAALPCAMITIALGAARLVDRLQTSLKQPPSPRSARTVAAVVALATVATLATAERPFTTSKTRADLKSLLGYAHAQPDLCGLNLFVEDETLWSLTGGYSFLRRPVPIYQTASLQAFAESKAGFNYVIARRSLPLMQDGLSIVHCAQDYCLFHQPVQCQPVAAHEISDELARTHQ